MKALPNYISITRIFLSFSLLFIEPLSSSFFVIYFVCGISDIIDGLLARSMGTSSKLGEKLDSIADLIMVSILLFILYPFFNPSVRILLWLGIIVVLRVSSMLVAKKKFNSFAILHTYGNKITGLILFVLPFFIPYISTKILIYIACSIASLSAAEELIIQLFSKELRVNTKGLFLN